MTMARFGRITAVQGDMLRFAGHVLSRQRNADVTDEQRLAAIEEGHAALVARVGRDLGFGLRAWHDVLSADADLRGQYVHPHAWPQVRVAVERAFEDTTRELLVATLGSRGHPCP